MARKIYSELLFAFILPNVFDENNVRGLNAASADQLLTVARPIKGEYPITGEIR
jgi:hypothetical protein